MLQEERPQEGRTASAGMRGEGIRSDCWVQVKEHRSAANSADQQGRSVLWRSDPPPDRRDTTGVERQ